eukprot:4204410-Pyramimonas_sp.AAC.1
MRVIRRLGDAPTIGETLFSRLQKFRGNASRQEAFLTVARMPLLTGLFPQCVRLLLGYQNDLELLELFGL